MEEQEKQISFFRFEDLRVYHKALDYFQWMKLQVKNFDDYDRKIIGKPLLKASASIALNIAEGSARHKSQFVIFLKDAKTALRECVVRTKMAQKEGLLNDEQMAFSNEQLEEMTKMLGAMVISLTRPATRDRGNHSEYRSGNSDYNQDNTDYNQETSYSSEMESSFEY
ncbi:MAG: four helix bundle protein [Bacteroidales bacterium]|jgi:four helix bundle protein|nr:four helix bundle protein [Bacteroidales bacterium]